MILRDLINGRRRRRSMAKKQPRVYEKQQRAHEKHVKDAARAKAGIVSKSEHDQAKQIRRREKEIRREEKEYIHARAAFYAEAARFTPVLAADTPVGRCFVRTGDADVGRDLFHDGFSSERRGLSHAFGALEKVGKLPRGERTTFIDVGANIGLATLAALQEYGFEDAWAFEPEPVNYRLLRINLVANDLESRVRAMPLAISDVKGEATLALNEENFGDHRIAAQAAPISEHGHAGRSVTVKTSTLDALPVAERLEMPGGGLLWMDTQGHELRVLAGAGSLLDKGLPVVIEFDPVLLGEDLAPLEDFIESHFTHLVDLGRKKNADLAPVASSEVRSISVQLGGLDFTNLLLYTE